MDKTASNLRQPAFILVGQGFKLAPTYFTLFATGIQRRSFEPA